MKRHSLWARQHPPGLVWPQKDGTRRYMEVSPVTRLQEKSYRANQARTIAEYLPPPPRGKPMTSPEDRPYGEPLPELEDQEKKNLREMFQDWDISVLDEDEPSDEEWEGTPPPTVTSRAESTDGSDTETYYTADEEP